MRKCYECGKKLRFWEGYSHPVLGKKELVCSKCFDELEESLEKYQNFITNYLKENQEQHFISKLNFKLRDKMHSHTK